MRRAVRRLLLTLWFALVIACGGLWVRSHWICDDLNWYFFAFPAAPGDTRELNRAIGSRHVNLISSRGGLCLTTSGSTPSLPARWRLIEFRGWHPPARSYPIRLRMRSFAGFGFVNEYRVGVTLPHAAALAVLVAPAIPGLLRVYRRWRRRAHRQCVNCGYDLRATPDRCPECGTAASGVARPAALYSAAT